MTPEMDQSRFTPEELALCQSLDAVAHGDDGERVASLWAHEARDILRLIRKLAGDKPDWRHSVIMALPLHPPLVGVTSDGVTERNAMGNGESALRDLADTWKEAALRAGERAHQAETERDELMRRHQRARAYLAGLTDTQLKATVVAILQGTE